jgi:hypothetical protein
LPRRNSAANLLRQGGLRQGTLTGTGPGNAWTATLFVPSGTPELHVTLAWTDPAGTPGGQILINDLDLRLIAPDATTFAPWTLNPLKRLGIQECGGDRRVSQRSAHTLMA